VKRDSSTIFIESQNATTPLPWFSNAPDFSAISEPTLSVLKAAWERDKSNIQVIADPVITPPVITPSWQSLQDALLGGVLYPLYTRITTSSFVLDPNTATLASIANANNISTASGKISDAITNTTVRIEAALASAIQLLKQSGYIFTAQEISDWNSTIQSLNFSNLVQI